MAVDTPARLVILGAGPIGLEAGLYARYLGYEVEIFESGRVAENVLRWGHVRMFSPFGMNRSPLGLAAMDAQDPGYQPPGDDELLTGRQWVERYLEPLAQTDLLAGHIRLHTRVLSVSREDFLKSEFPGGAEREESPFRILVEDEQKGQHDTTADVVIDTTGLYGNPGWMGPGGAAAMDETRIRDRIEYSIPDLLDEQRQRYAGRKVLLVGSGYSAATSIVALEQLAAEAPGTEVTWITRRRLGDGSSGPVEVIDNDRLPERQKLAVAANRCASGENEATRHWPATTVRAVAYDPATEQFTVSLAGRHEGELQCDRIIANVGFRPDARLYEELQVHQCYATEGPMKLAAALLKSTSADCLDQTSQGPEALLNPEPNFYILGAKSYGRNSKFLVSIGLQQIRELFTIIADREDLDLYQTMRAKG